MRGTNPHPMKVSERPTRLPGLVLEPTSRPSTNPPSYPRKGTPNPHNVCFLRDGVVFSPSPLCISDRYYLVSIFRGSSLLLHEAHFPIVYRGLVTQRRSGMPPNRRCNSTTNAPIRRRAEWQRGNFVIHIEKISNLPVRQRMRLCVRFVVSKDLAIILSWRRVRPA